MEHIEIPEHIVKAVREAVSNELTEGANDLREAVDRNRDEQLEYWVDLNWSEAEGEVDTNVDDLRDRYVASAIARAEAAHEPDLDDEDWRVEAEEEAEVIFDNAVNEAEKDALQDVNSWQSWGSGDESTVDVGREFEVDYRDTEHVYSEEVGHWLAELITEDEDLSEQAARTLYEQMRYEGENLVEHDSATAIITHIDSDGDIHYEISSHDTVQPSLKIADFQATVRRILIEEHFPELAKDEVEQPSDDVAPDLVVDFSRAARRRLEPYELVNLKTKQQLREESADMRHCVGRSDMGYDKAVARGKVEIWSLRTHGGKRKFTLEIAKDVPGGRIVQMKGKPNNRRPGFDVGEKTLQNEEEVRMCVDAVDELVERGLVSPSYGAETIDDLAPGMKAIGMLDETRTRKNPSRADEPPRSFDEPWTPASLPRRR